jgi:hypothetical protein
MDKTALVSFDVDNGQRVIDAMDKAGIAPEVALWAVLPQYEDWRLIVASSKIDRHSDGYEPIVAAMHEAKIPFLSEPVVYLRDLNDSFILDLRRQFANAGDTYGMRLGGQKFASQYIEDAFVYRIR